MSFFKRLEGTFFSPRQMFQALADKPVWVDALVVLLILLAVFSSFIAPYSQNDQLQMMKDSAKLKQRMGETRYNEYLEKLESAPKSGIIIRNVIAGPAMSLIGLLFSSLIIMILGRFISSQGKYVQIVSAVIHASFVDKLLGNAVRFLLISAKKSVMQTSTSLALLFPRMEVTSPAYVVLGQIDFFQLWMFGILAFGLSSIFKIEVKKAMFLSYSFWLLKSLIYIALGIIGLQYLK
jgi:hypothetical protein